MIFLRPFLDSLTYPAFKVFQKKWQLWLNCKSYRKNDVS